MIHRNGSDTNLLWGELGSPTPDPNQTILAIRLEKKVISLSPPWCDQHISTIKGLPLRPYFSFG
jgi:hypothetical protein